MAATKLVVEPTESVSAQSTVPTHEEIQLRAYQIWQTRLRHGIEGDAGDDWYNAEQELKESKSHSPENEAAEV